MTRAPLLAFLALLAAQAGAADVAIARHHPCNLFPPGQAAVLQAELRGFPAGAGQAVAVLHDAFGAEVWRAAIPVTVIDGRPSALAIDLGAPRRGWYALEVGVTVGAVSGSGGASLGVADLFQRTAAEARAQDRRFGLKWWGGVTDKAETVEMMAALGLQWTRIIHNEGGELGTLKMLQEHPINAVIKIERFPKELYDSARYGDLAQWEASYGRGAWALKTLPRKEPYQAWLRAELAKLPRDQQVFEIWNEPWDKMSPEDFAILSQWIVEVVRADRPDAVIGPNLMGSTSDFQYDARVVRAGGMQGMDMVCLHPYASSEDRAWLRGYIAWMSQQTGRPISIYVTEYGSHSTPEGPAKRSELDQAERVARQSLALYAEGVKALIPHWVGQSERDRTYIEDWFGFIRRNQEPKPVLIAHATCARMIDGSRWLGDLWLGPGVDAMLFARDRREVLALCTHGETRDVDLDTGAAQVVRHDLFGGETPLATANGRVHLTVGPDVSYLTGTALAAQASHELRADRWPKPAKAPRNSRTIHRPASAPVIDGAPGEWNGATQLALLNPKVNGDDASGTASLAWDERNLYLTVVMRDNELLNIKPRAKLYQQDSIELFVSAQPRDEGSGYGEHDHQIFFAPTSAENVPILGLLADRQAGTLADIAGSAFRVVKSGTGWSCEIAIPWSTFPGFVPAPGARLAFEMRVNDADSSHERWKIDPVDGDVQPENPSAWSLLLLAD
jgi:hypothetical protein